MNSMNIHLWSHVCVCVDFFSYTQQQTLTRSCTPVKITLPDMCPQGLFNRYRLLSLRQDKSRKQKKCPVVVQHMNDICLNQIAERHLHIEGNCWEMSQRINRFLIGSWEMLRFCTHWRFGILRLESQMDFIDLSSCWMFPWPLRLQ